MIFAQSVLAVQPSSREKLHELPWLKKYGFTHLLEESAWTSKHFSRKVTGAKKR